MTIRHPFHIEKTIFTAIILFAGLILAPSIAAAGLSGLVDLSYVKYDSTINGQKTLDVSSFKQQYSLIYDNGGAIGDRRLGRYKYAVGYEWASFDTKIKTPSGDSNPSLDMGHILYEGEMVMDPKELPFRFKAYSRDMNRITTATDTVSTLSDPTRLIAPNVVSNLQDGTHISSGATLVFGVKNGMTNGYNAIFRDIPMILVDYQDTINRDMKSQTPVDNRLSRLAFVSLNKKDNWFHYRKTVYNDYINSASNYSENQYQLGTIDQTQNRRWIDLTNWIKISADIQLTERTDNNVKSFDQYDLNLFATASRSRWEAKTFNTFTRTVYTDHTQFTRKTPLYVNGVWGSDTDWSLSVTSEDGMAKTIASEARSSDVLTSMRVNTYKHSSFTLSPSLSVERYESGGDKNIIMNGGVETASTRRFSDKYALFANYNISRSSSDSPTTGSKTYTTHNLAGRATYTPSNTLRFELEERLSAASGSLPKSSGPTLAPTNTFTFTSNAFQVNPDSSYRRSSTNFRTNWNPLARLRVSMTIGEDIYAQDNQPNIFITTATNSVDYSMPTLTLGLTTTGTRRSQGSVSDYAISSQGSVSYNPSRSIAAALRGTYTKENSGGADTTGVDFQQTLNYYFFKSNGEVRTLLELNEEFTYTETDSTVAAAQIKKGLLLGFRYFPIKRIFIASSAKYTLVEPGNGKELIANASIGMNFKKLQLSADYSYGKREGGDNRIDKRLSLNLKKPF